MSNFDSISSLCVTLQVERKWEHFSLLKFHWKVLWLSLSMPKSYIRLHRTLSIEISIRLQEKGKKTLKQETENKMLMKRFFHRRTQWSKKKEMYQTKNGKTRFPKTLKNSKKSKQQKRTKSNPNSIKCDIFESEILVEKKNSNKLPAFRRAFQSHKSLPNPLKI